MENTEVENSKIKQAENMECSSLEAFISTGRTGRRNAMGDILDEQHASVSTGSLPFDMEKLSCSDDAKGATSSPQGSSNSAATGQGS